MIRNGPLALAFHALFIGFIFAPLLIVCVVAFTPLGYISLPTDGSRCAGSPPSSTIRASSARSG